MDKDVCKAHGTLPITMIMVSNGTPVCATCHEPLYTQAELDSGDPPVYERNEQGNWVRAEGE